MTPPRVAGRPVCWRTDLRRPPRVTLAPAGTTRTRAVSSHTETRMVTRTIEDSAATARSSDARRARPKRWRPSADGGPATEPDLGKLGRRSARPMRGALVAITGPVRPRRVLHAVLRPRVLPADRAGRAARLPAEPADPGAQAAPHPRAARCRPGHPGAARCSGPAAAYCWPSRRPTGSRARPQSIAGSSRSCRRCAGRWNR